MIGYFDSKVVLEPTSPFKGGFGRKDTKIHRRRSGTTKTIPKRGEVKKHASDMRP
jgi:hypothetical protein